MMSPAPHEHGHEHPHEHSGGAHGEHDGRVREFRALADHWEDGPSRRRFLEIMAASLGLAGLQGCQQPQERIVPFVRAPEQLVPGEPLYFATSMTLDGETTGLIATSHMGRPTKLDGNPEHPAVPGVMAGATAPWDGERPRVGASTAFAQAATLGLYDPDCSQSATQAGQVSTWKAFVAASDERLAGLRERGGAGLFVLTGAVTSPTVFAQIERLRELYPRAAWHQYEPLHADNELAGAQMAFGRFWRRDTTCGRPMWSWPSTRIFWRAGRTRCSTSGRWRIGGPRRGRARVAIQELLMATRRRGGCTRSSRASRSPARRRIIGCR